MASNRCLTALNRAARTYTAVATILLTTVAAFALLNLAVHFLLLPRLHELFARLPVASQSNVTALGLENLRKVYPGMDDDDIAHLIGETWGRGQIYEPWAEFKEMPFSGRYYNQSVHGFRSNGTFPQWPPSPDHFNIFMFGGSTLYGYSVPDAQTLPAYLSAILAEHFGPNRVVVYNFGNGFYYSVQERIRLENLLMSATVPNMAIFFDGLNDFLQITPDGGDLPSFKYLVEAALRGEYHVKSSVLSELPIVKLFKDIKSLARGPSVDPAQSPQSLRVRRAPDIKALRRSWAEQAPLSLLEQVITRYRRNKSLIEQICHLHAVMPIFVWQPVPSYNYDLRHHLFLFSKNPLSGHIRGQEGYALARSLWHDGAFGTNFLWLADTQEHLREPLYVDTVHYSSAFNRKLAERILQFILPSVAGALASK